MPTPPTLSGEEHPPKGKAVTSPVCLPVGKLVPILAGGWGWGWLLLPRGLLPPSLCAPLPGQADAELCPSAPTVAGGGFRFPGRVRGGRRATLRGHCWGPLFCCPGDPVGSKSPRIVSSALETWINAFEEMLGWHPEPFQHGAKSKDGAVKLHCGGGEEDAVKPMVAPCSFVDPRIRGNGILL